MKTLKAVLTFTLAGMIANAAHAQPPGSGARSVVVRFADLNLHDNAGIAVLHARIRAAADEVCGSADSRNLLAITHVRLCTSRAVERAIASINSRALDELASNASIRH